jgi:hypothetical protein
VARPAWELLATDHIAQAQSALRSEVRKTQSKALLARREESRLMRVGLAATRDLWRLSTN